MEAMRTLNVQLTLEKKKKVAEGFKSLVKQGLCLPQS